MTRNRIRPRGSVPTPIPSDWDEEQATCPGCRAIIYGNNKCCDGIRSLAAFAATERKETSR